MIDKSIRSGDPKVDAYIELLESKFEFNKLYQFIMAANDISGIMAEDMVKIAKGDGKGLKILSKDKDEKFTERLTLILKQIDVVKKISEEADKLITSGKVKDPSKLELDPNKPLIEQLGQYGKRT
jgi:hypothetical protein